MNSATSLLGVEITPLPSSNPCSTHFDDSCRTYTSLSPGQLFNSKTVPHLPVAVQKAPTSTGEGKPVHGRINDSVCNICSHSEKSIGCRHKSRQAGSVGSVVSSVTAGSLAKLLIAFSVGVSVGSCVVGALVSRPLQIIFGKQYVSEGQGESPALHVGAQAQVCSSWAELEAQ